MKPNEAKQLKAGDIIVLKSGLIGKYKDDFPYTDEACRIDVHTGTGTTDLNVYYESIDKKLDINFIPVVGKKYEFQSLEGSENRRGEFIGYDVRHCGGTFICHNINGGGTTWNASVRQLPIPTKEPSLKTKPLERLPKTYSFLIDPKKKDTKGNPSVVGFIQDDDCWFVESDNWYKAPASECCRFEFVTGDKCVKVPIRIDSDHKVLESHFKGNNQPELHLAIEVFEKHRIGVDFVLVRKSDYQKVDYSFFGIEYLPEPKAAQDKDDLTSEEKQILALKFPQWAGAKCLEYPIFRSLEDKKYLTSKPQYYENEPTVEVGRTFSLAEPSREKKPKPLQEPPCLVTLKVIHIIMEQLGVSISQTSENAVITDDLGADSLDEVELTMRVEEEFQIEISDSEVEKVKTVGDVIELVKSKLPEESK